ncbi:Transcription factor IBH1 [Striga hermonthica]|uniref:Transcription factor IBH1 n=1 Tax=Striga hermonthica TaxID=68872 RepID=A0A9N7P1F4_STRHE|nr:Transcription factor IBH1 [Striga hermonthica]
MKKTSSNPSPIEARLALNFLRAIKKIASNPRKPSSAHKTKRPHEIRAAAYASMASVAGPNKAWSRALLRSIKNRWRQRAQCDPARNNSIGLGCGGPEKDLRELVPGGKSLDLAKLLNETGHYIKCLRAQVEVMRKIADYSSSSSSSK